MNNLQEEIKRSKSLMGLSEGLNLPKSNPVSWTIDLLKKLIVNIDNPDTSDPKYLSYYDGNGQLVLDENISGKYQKGWWSISYEKIYYPVEQNFKLPSYDLVAPIIKNALEKIFNKPVDFVHNVSKLETKFYRKND